MRDRKERKLYTDDWMLGEEDDIEGRRSFRLEDKMETDKFTQTCFIKEMNGADLTLSYLQKNGFNTPMLFREKTGLGIRVPTQEFTVTHVKMCVGSRRVLDVMDVNTQKNQEMTMKEWCRYYNDPNKDRLLNVISLEFSHTKLENYVQSPTIVRQLDWVDCVWPAHLKEAQTEATNAIDEMMYPKVQKYCLMSVKGCYTDFHIDFGGTSVWYHILKGSKIFWLIPPTERNVALYEQWVLSGKQGDIFFADTVEKCQRITLNAGNTFFIPTGWIHAVYTPSDSLVFGGNFLHSFGIERQLKIAQVEDTTHVPQKFRYPFFTEMLWYVLEKYVHCLLGQSHLDDVPPSSNSPTSPPAKHVHLTPQELHGLKAIVMYLHSLPTNRKNVPELIKDPIALVKDVRTVVEQHRHDSAELAVTGKSVLRVGMEDIDLDGRMKKGRFPLMKNAENRSPKLHKLSHRSPAAKGNGPRRRRTRCKKCEACQRNDCGECSFCLDMVKFGGPGRAKQTCVMRQCLQPMLPVTAACLTCGLDGWGQQPVIPIQKIPRDTPSTLMECSVCYEIAHPECYTKNYPDLEGVVNEDLPNSWECPKCCKDGKNVEYRQPRHFRARQKSTDIRRMSVSSDAVDSKDNIKTEPMEGDSESRDSEGFSRPATPAQLNELPKRPKLEPKEDRSSPTEKSNFFFDGFRGCNTSTPLKHSRSSEDVSCSNSSSGPTAEPRKLALRTQLAQQLTGSSNKVLKRPVCVVRPAPGVRQNLVVKDNNLALERSCIVPVFRYLTPMELVECSLVCRAWARYSLEPSLWRKMDLSHKRLTASHLAGIARRQPETLILDWTNIAKKQLGWLIGRLPQLRELSIQGCSWAGVSALRTCVCPPLHSLDLSFVSGMNDSSLRDILSPPPDSRPGLLETRSRLRHLRCLKISGCDISDVSLRYITQHLPKLAILDLSSCGRITDAGVAQLSTPQASTIDLLTDIDLSNCRSITELSLEHLQKCIRLGRINLSHTPLISNLAISKFVQKNKNNLRVVDGKLIQKV
ncbi:hypothetical protein RUM44_012382 [Polyplax serrata]|uniref:[Histone H3]-dimethyl-L-lysine(36) demethylase n=1 Tax=Polyplax serrata TaxID=468196 RepID=A0ABR1BFK3_POLSC